MTGITISSTITRASYLEYQTGTTSITIPECVSITIHLQAAGGSGNTRTSPAVDGSAGGGGGYARITRDVLPGEIGTTLTVTIGAGVSDAAGGNTTLSGTLNGAAVSVTCNGGTRGTASADGTGGSASGGDVNISGEDGYGFSADPGNELPGTPGQGGGRDQPGSLIPVGFGAPGCGGNGSTSLPDLAGEDGSIVIWWT